MRPRSFVLSLAGGALLPFLRCGSPSSAPPVWLAPLRRKTPQTGVYAQERALCATLWAMRADDRETGPRTDQQVDAVAGVMAQVDGDLPSAGTHSASYWRRGSEPARSGIGASVRAASPDHTNAARGGLAAAGVECTLTDSCHRGETRPRAVWLATALYPKRTSPRNKSRGLVCV